MSSRGNKRSIVWQFFNFTSDNKFVVCSLCKKQFKFFKNTTNLKEHLKRVHPSNLLPPPPPLESHDEDEPSTPVASTSRTLSPQPSTSSGSASVQQITSTPVPSTSGVPSSSGSQASTPTLSVRPKKQLRLFGSTRSNKDLTGTQITDLNTALIKMIVLDYQPLRIVEDRGFQEFVRKLNPLYPIPSRKMLSSQLLPQVYESEVRKLKQKLSSVQHVAVTTDMWTSDSNIHYVTVTVHFSVQAILHASALQTSEVKGSQTGAQIAWELEEIFNQWEIIDKIITIVSDNGANIKSAINDHLRKHHHPCVAHTLNLCAKDCMNENDTLSAILQKCRQIVGHFKHSALAAQKLTNMQQQMNTPQLKVKQDVATRWNSTYFMLQRLVDIKAPITAVMSGLQRAPQMLSADEWLIIEDCVKLLKPLDAMTTILSGEKYVTLSSIIPLVRGLQHLKIISKRLGGYEKDRISSKATFLDPRYKKHGFGSQENADNAEKWVLEELGSIFAKTSLPPTVPEEEEIQDRASSDSDMLWEYLDQKVADSVTSHTTSPTAQAILMVKHYLSMPNIPRASNPLTFWLENKNLFPELYTMQEKYLCVPATSVPSERIFSKTAIITNSRRNRLSPNDIIL